MQNGHLSRDRLVMVCVHYGTVVRCHMLEAQPYATPKAFVEFATVREARDAKEALNDTVIDGVVVKIFWARNGPRNGWSSLPLGVVKNNAPRETRSRVHRRESPLSR